MISVHHHEDAASFLRHVAPFLEADEERYGLLLGLARRFAGEQAQGEEFVFATVQEADDIVGVTMRTPGHKVLLSDLPMDAIAPLAHSIAERLDAVPGVQGELTRARAFAALWSGSRSVTMREGRAQRIYVCHKVIEPQPTHGAMRPATVDDRLLLIDWCRAFMVDVASEAPTNVEAYVDRALSVGAMILWDVDGEPVSTAMTSRKTPRGASVSLVYTPPRHRGRGYASNVTAALTARMLDSGKSFTTLYTDLANKTTNKIYPAIGYRPLTDEIEIWFDPVS